ncbi:MAG: ABC transporter substrate-binding protein [Clostridia bacterium]|nr:ABC transporter substrate-binding protein [Clostridia bacterium]
MLKRLFTILLLLLTLSSCQKETIVVSDGADSGTSVQLPETPERVAVLFSSLADIWVTAGGKVDITVGETVERGFANNDAVLVDGGAGKTIDLEALVAAKPDVIFASADVEAQVNAARFCLHSDIASAISLRVDSFEDYLEVLKIMTTLTGENERYETYGLKVKEEIDGILRGTDASGKKVLFIRAASSAKATKAKTADDHFAAAMLKDFGTCNIAESAPVLLDGISYEEILLQNPEHIFISTMGDELAAKAYINSMFCEPLWQSIDAVKNGNVHFLPKELFQYKPNSRWADAYEYLAEILK